MKTSRFAWSIIIIFIIVLIDQLSKIWIKTHFFWGESLEILPFFELRFVQNPGMAFGWELGSKLFLTIFRIIAVGVLLFYLFKLRTTKLIPRGYVMCVALITAGAAGNIFDCVLYGEIFNNPYPPQVATFVPWGEGYAPVFEGMVVDMLYFPLFSFVWPDWIPFIGGADFSFFDPVFNIADASISVGMAVVIIFYNKYILMTKDSQIAERESKGGNDSKED